MKIKSVIMDEEALRRSLIRITHEIIEKNRGTESLCLLGIRRRGIPLAQRLCRNIAAFEGVDVPIGHIDISLYRDDLTELVDLPTAGDSDIPFDLKDKRVILVDDVIYTGRTARAAIDCVLHHGRPQSIQLAVLIDRGHRELPIRPDYVGKNIPTSRTELVSVMLKEVDERDGVVLCDIPS